MERILYKSTNGMSEPVRFKEALLRGQAEDGGLFMPNKIPKFQSGELNQMRGMSYSDIAFAVTGKFLEHEIPNSELMRITKQSYTFDIPIINFDPNRYVMLLDRGPTASFKDFGARMMARLMQHYMKDENKQLVILVATSGDTGSAIANAFYGLDNIKIVIFFPENEVTGKQRKQMTTLGGNIVPLAIKGKFDDCQSFAKQALKDPELRLINLSSANSISWGRLLPQAVYYVYAHSVIGGDSIAFSVPCGNFGNITGGLIAKNMGLPVTKFISAVNENDEFPYFLNTGRYVPIEPSISCPSNSMNVGKPNNLPRIVALYNGAMDDKGKIHKMPDLEAMRRDIFSVSISNEMTREAIKEAYDINHLVLEPHGAVAWVAMVGYLRPIWTSTPYVALETAHPAKFPEEIEDVLHRKVEEPACLRGLEEKTEKFEILPKDYGVFKQFLRDTV